MEPPDLPIRRIGGASLNGISNGERKRVSFLTALRACGAAEAGGFDGGPMTGENLGRSFFLFGALQGMARVFWGV